MEIHTNIGTMRLKEVSTSLGFLFLVSISRVCVFFLCFSFALNSQFGFDVIVANIIERLMISFD